MNSSIDKAGKKLRKSVLLFMTCALLVLLVVSVLTGRLVGRRVALDLFIYTAFVVGGFSIFVYSRPDLFRRPSGQVVSKFELANILTALRIFLVPPVLVFLSHGMNVWGFALYALILLTDVGDGCAARKLGQETRFGLMLDPFADIASTMAIFTWLWLKGGVPGWLYLLLVLRYSEFFFGMVYLSTKRCLPELHATIAGKTAGVVQGLGILILVLQRIMPSPFYSDVVGMVIFPILALAFISTIVSQTVIGVRAAGSDKLKAGGR
ncbi:MAG: CDP-alcohol phosphatidyltransferase family protein [Candidatus Krumholzibacteria bacterium]|nr:CDP-alcohol phosphatidyltransferase family protein [Candidatus Krumholzibacteria bacterium]